MGCSGGAGSPPWCLQPCLQPVVGAAVPQSLFTKPTPRGPSRCVPLGAPRSGGAFWRLLALAPISRALITEQQPRAFGKTNWGAAGRSHPAAHAAATRCLVLGAALRSPVPAWRAFHGRGHLGTAVHNLLHSLCLSRDTCRGAGGSAGLPVPWATRAAPALPGCPRRGGLEQLGPGGTERQRCLRPDPAAARAQHQPGRFSQRCVC